MLTAYLAARPPPAARWALGNWIDRRIWKSSA